MIAMHVCVDHEADRRGRQLADGGDDAIGDGGKLRVGDEDSVRTDERGSPAALPVEA